MNYIYAFLFAGLACSIAQVIMDNTKLTPGHITSLFTVAGVILSFLGIYDIFLDKFGAGASVIISNFGHMLYTATLQGYTEEGILGIFSYMLTSSSLAITSVIINSFLLSLIFKPKD